MNVNSIMKMRELELESEEQPKPESDSDDDDDTCDNNEINRLFGNCRSISEQAIALNKKYILQIAGTLESNPNVALSLSDNTCEVHNLSNNQFAKLIVLDEHTDVISEIKFSSENSNLLYTGSNDGSVKLWDLRTPKKSVLFKDTTIENDKFKQITCFDISPNNILLAAGTNLSEGDSFVLFWDIRNHSLLGGYWESHTDDITQVKFHPSDSNKLISGSVDGLINLYDLSQSKEEDALIDSLNTESSIEKLGWYQDDVISCITHTADVQFWKLEDAQPYSHLHRAEIAKGLKRKSEEYVYVVDVHDAPDNMLLLAGSNYLDGECFRGLSVQGNSARPALGFTQNQQRVRASWSNFHANLLLTGGEKGILNAWDIKSIESSTK